MMLSTRSINNQVGHSAPRVNFRGHRLSRKNDTELRMIVGLAISILTKLLKKALHTDSSAGLRDSDKDDRG